jgi:hypothetical protein
MAFSRLAIDGKSSTGLENAVRKSTSLLLGVIAGFGAGITPLVAQDEFPIVGVYTENVVCKGDASDAGAPRVKITLQEIESSVFGLCAIQGKKREGKVISVHVECKGPGGATMLGDVNFTIKDDNTLDFADHDNTYKAVLYKCP